MTTLAEVAALVRDARGLIGSGDADARREFAARKAALLAKLDERIER